MKSAPTVSRLAAALLLLLAGCSAKLPQTQELSGAPLQQAEERLRSFLAQSCVEAVDSDIKLSWKAYGQEETYPAVLQAMAPSSLRLALIDPLGRPLLLLGSDGKTFTMADNSKSIGYTGTADLKMVRRFVPDFIPTGDFFLWLGGRIGKQEKMRPVSAALDDKDDKDTQLDWYESSADNKTHLIAIDEKGRLRRHLVMDKEEDKILFDARYSGYVRTGKDCGWPGRIDISGTALEAAYSLQFTEVVSHDPIDGKQFQIKLPAHFTVKKLADP